MRGAEISPQRSKRVCLPRRGVPLPTATRAKITAALTLRPPPAEVAAILEHYRSMGIVRVARCVGYDRKVVRRVLEEAGVPIRPRITEAPMMQLPAEDVAAILAGYRTMGMRRLARRVGYDKKVVRRVLEEAGVPIRARGRHRETHGAPRG
jgi:uncharacterized protein (UPF0335 family)